MAQFSEDSPDAIPLHEFAKMWAHVFVSDGVVYVQTVVRNKAGYIQFDESIRMTPRNAGLLIKALKRAIKEAKRSGRGGND